MDNVMDAKRLVEKRGEKGTLWSFM